MKKHLLSLAGLFLITLSTFAQFTAGEIWSMNLRVDPITHNSINLAGIEMAVTYNSNGIPLSGISAPQLGLPLFQITSTVTGNSVVCLSQEKDGNNPWEDKERTTFSSDGTNDTTIVVERSNNGGPFLNSSKIVILPGSNPNQFSHIGYRWNNNQWELGSKTFYYLSSSKLDSVVSFTISGADSTRNSFTYYYYSNGLDSSLQTVLQASNNQFDLRNKIIVEQKDNGKTKRFGIYSKNTSTFIKTATVTYSNIASSIGEYEINNAISLYPNPANSNLQLNVSSNLIAQTLTIININGQIVKEIPYSSNIDISDLSNGIYFIQVKSENGLSTQKLIKN
jgi:hypothetical protein